MYLRRNGWADARLVLRAHGRRRDPAAHHRADTCTIDMGRARLRAPERLPERAARTAPARSTAAGREFAFQFVQVGNPQCAIEVERGPRGARPGALRRRRSSATSCSRAAPTCRSGGATGDAAIRARIFERGVGETMSSGTGATGAAVAAVLRGVDSPVTVALDGGELEVEVGEDLHVDLTGWARPVYRGDAERRADRGAACRPSKPPGAPARRTCSPSSSARSREKKAAGVDVISPRASAIPTRPTPDAGGRRARRARAADPGTHQYPSNRGRPELREAFARFYERRFGVELDPDTEIIPALGAKECVFNLNLAFLDPDIGRAGRRPGLPGLHRRPAAGGRRGGADAAAARARLRARPRRDRRRRGRARARLMFLNYPNNPTGAVVPDGLFERAVEFGREHDVLIVHDASYTETTFDGYVAPSFLETPGAKEVGVEVFSLSKGWNMTGWRTAAIVGNAEAVNAYWQLKTNIDSGMFEAVQLAAARGARRRAARPRCARSTQRRRDLVCDALREIGVDVTPPQGHDLRLGAGARRATPRPRTASWCSRSPAWSCRPAAPTGPTARASSASR